MYATLIPVDSTAIRAVAFDGHTLTVLFHTSDKPYDHPRVPDEVFEGLMRASSKGEFYSKHIRGKYK